MGGETATRFNALNNYNTSTEETSANAVSNSAAARAPTTYQIRATGDGSFRTVPVVFSPSQGSNPL